MIILLSPAKTLNEAPTAQTLYSQPRFLAESEKIVKVMQKKTSKKLQDMMSVSEKIASLNVERYGRFSTPFDVNNAKQAILTFRGDVYVGLDAENLSEPALEFAQKQVRILSGLYGLLRPMDLMQAYRLEMGTKVKIGRTENLYKFWGDKLTEAVNDDLAASGSDVVLNLASKEYFSAIKPKKLQGKLINVHFKENRNGVLKVISFNAKKARGTMTKLIVQDQLTDLEEIKGLNVNHYIMNDALSSDTEWMFVK